jgi:predicted RNA binding protein YcfA (HicA-like mRNA interferase family)
MKLSPKHLITTLEQHGFLYKRSRGAHRLYYNPTTNKTVIVPVYTGSICKLYIVKYRNKYYIGGLC